MAERSIGMTTGSGDGDVGGYNSSRMTAMFDATFGSGILSYGNMFTLTGSGTATMTIASGDAVIGGFFYENTSSTNLTITGVANGTYYLVIRVNNTGSAVTVARSEGTGATNTTIAAYTVRLALVSSVNSATDITLYTIAVSGGTWTLSGQGRDFANTRQLAHRTTAYIYGYSNAAVATGTASYSTVATTFPSPSTNSQNANILKAELVGGVPRITIYAPGNYIADCLVEWDTNTTGSRFISLGANVGASTVGSHQYSHAVTAASIVNAFHSSRCVQKAQFTFTITPSGALGSQFVELRVAQNSGANRSIENSYISLTRI